MKKTILIPTDFSKNAWEAIKYTLNMYSKVPCTIYFVNVYNFPGGYIAESSFVTMPSNEIYKEFKELSEKKLKETLEKAELEFNNNIHSYQSISEHNTLFNFIYEYTASNPVDLIVMGTKGATSNADVIYGSNTVDVMQNITQCPVLAIPESTNFKIPKELVFATDYNIIYDYKKLEVITEIARLYTTKICVLHINTEVALSELQEFNKTLLEEYLFPFNYEIRSLSNNNLFDSISCFVQSRGSDMVSFFSEKHGIFENIFTNPLVKNMGKHSKVPVLVLH